MVTIISRQAWGARPPKNPPTPIVTPTPELWLHHTAASAADWHGPEGMRRIQDLHIDQRGWDDIAYSFVVDSNGAIYEGRGVGVSGAHTQGHNSKSHGICVMGNFQTDPATPDICGAVAALVRHGHLNGWWPSQLTGGHRDTKPTLCPGDLLYSKIPVINNLALEGPMATYTDVPETHPFYDDIEWASQKGYLVGDKAKKLFYPDAPITRGQAAVLARRMLDTIGHDHQ